MTKIEWTDKSWNPTIGCRKVSPGCKNCYAMVQAKRIVAMTRGRQAKDPEIEGTPYEGVVRMTECPDCADPVARNGCSICNGTGAIPKPEWNGRALFLESRLDQPMRWPKSYKIFVNSMSDLFHEDLSFPDIAAVWGVMASTPRHTFQVLTKRPERALEFFEWLDGAVDGSGEDHLTAIKCHAQFDMNEEIEELAFRDIWSKHRSPQRGAIWPLPNVWLGVSAEDQETANERVSLLLECPAAIHFVSAEPLLGPIDFTKIDDPRYIVENSLGDDQGRAGVRPVNLGTVQGVKPLDWVIVGGESGPDSRPFHLNWARSIVDQCRRAKVPVFVKQLGYRAEDPENGIAGAGVIVPADAAQLVSHRLKDRKGADKDEWPEELRVQEWPGAGR